MKKGKLVIISAPSGAGKTTIVRHLLDSDLDLEFSISATTRVRRENETEKKDYYFLTVDQFRTSVEKGDFVEWEEVYPNYFYGTLKSEIERIWSKGNHVLFDVDVRGGLNLKKKFGSDSIALFIMPPSVEELEKRLIQRGTDDPDVVKMRIMKAAREINYADRFDRIVINDQLETARNEAYNIIFSFLND